MLNSSKLGPKKRKSNQTERKKQEHMSIDSQDANNLGLLLS